MSHRKIIKPKKKATEVSTDELMYREFLQNQWKIEPGRRAVEILREKILKVLKLMGVDITKDDDSISFQMQVMDIFINSLSEQEVPKAAGIYFTWYRNGDIVPFAYIPSAQVHDMKYIFPIYLWVDQKYIEGTPETIQ